MTDEDVKKISKAFNGKFKLLLAEIARVKREVSDIKSGQFNQYSELSKIGRDITRIDSTLDSIAEESGKQSKKLGILWEQVGEVTVALDGVKETLEIHTTFLKGIKNYVENDSDNIHKLNKRVVTLENTAGIVSPPELTI